MDHPVQICDDFDELVSAVAVAGSAKTNLLSLLGGFSSSNEAPRVSRLFPAVATTLTRIPEGRQRDKMVAFALSKSVSYLKRLSEQGGNSIQNHFGLCFGLKNHLASNSLHY